MTASNPNLAWPLPSSAENAGRQLALRAALDYALSPLVVNARLGTVPTEERVLELADTFAAWLEGPKPEPDNQCRPVFQAVPGFNLGGVLKPAVDAAERLQEAIRAASAPADAAEEAAPTESGDSAIDDYIASDNRVIALTEKLIAEQRQLAQRMVIAEGKIDNLLRRPSRRAG